MNDVNTHELILEEAKRIKASGVLGRSRAYKRLLDFLVACTIADRKPKEYEIATEVFGRGQDFDPSQDSMVRVYVHHLRQRIQRYYADQGRESNVRISIPKGEYRLASDTVDFGPEHSPTVRTDGELPTEDAASAPDKGGPDRRPVEPLIGPRLRGFGIAGITFLAGWLLSSLPLSEPQQPPTATTADSSLWTTLLDDDMPILLLVGDYYIVGEFDSTGNIDRLVRHFEINSRAELDEFLMTNPEYSYIDLDLTYLPSSTAFAIHDVLRVFHSKGKSVRIVPMSAFNVSDVKSHHIVYIGYLSGLEQISPFVFGSSELSIGLSYDEIQHIESGNTYISEAGMPAFHNSYLDYGLYSTFPGPGGNQIAVIAGTRDAGLMHTAQAVTTGGNVREIEALVYENGAPIGPPAFEVLFEVTGYDRMSLDATPVHHATLDYQRVWGGTTFGR